MIKPMQPYQILISTIKKTLAVFAAEMLSLPFKQAFKHWLQSKAQFEHKLICVVSKRKDMQPFLIINSLRSTWSTKLLQIIKEETKDIWTKENKRKDLTLRYILIRVIWHALMEILLKMALLQSHENFVFMSPKLEWGL